jgi:hypothetical protein
MSLSNINNGLVFAASPTLPEYPDNAAGTTYLGRNFTGSGSPLDGWTATGCTLSTSGGNLIVTATASFPRIVRTVTAERTVRFRVRRIAGIATNSRITNTTGTVYENTVLYDSTNTHIHDFYIGAGATGELRIIPGSAGSAAGDVYEISFIYIGDGTYSSRLLDASGNGNHGTVFGATPTANGGLSFDGINDGTRIPSISTGQLFADAASRWSVVVNTNVANPSTVIAGRAGVTAAARVFAITTASNSTLRTRLRGVETPISAPLTGMTFIAITWDGTTALAYVGTDSPVVVAVGTATDDNTAFTIGARDGLDATFAQGTIRDPRIYNRALTAAEITALATNPDAYNLDRVVRSITPVPGSVMTRDINGDTQVRRLESTIATGTAPLTVASTTLVPNLNADRVDSLEGSDFVRSTGTVAQNITGVKTFTAIPVLPASNPTTADQATRKAYVDGLDGANVKLTGAQSVGGVKTFTSIPVLPASNPTTGNQATRKTYVDTLDGANVKLTGDQTVAGNKTFSAAVTLPAIDPTSPSHAARKAYIDGKVPGKITVSTLAPSGGADGDIWITI